jgi:hypothetical protein
MISTYPVRPEPVEGQTVGLSNSPFIFDFGYFMGFLHFSVFLVGGGKLPLHQNDTFKASEWQLGIQFP